ncbi:MAG TPA: SAM-dependent methyltransferase [Kineosporiaceae bacterium]|nr:SAM-dependent methyltransferase [Kineosporiaceae bacterium]
MAEDLAQALAGLRPLLLDVDGLVRAVAAGRRRGQEPTVQRAELRPVDLKAGRRLQVVTTDGRTPTTRNHPAAAAGALVDALLAEPFGNWHVETADQVVQLRVTKKGLAQVHVSRTSRRGVAPAAGHDRARQRLLDPADPLFDALGADADKRRQVDAFLRQLATVAPQALGRADAEHRPLRVVDLGCGNAYLTFAAHRWLSAQARPDGGPRAVRTIGVDVRPELVARNADLAVRLGMSGLDFVTGAIADADPRFGPESCPDTGSCPDTESRPDAGSCPDAEPGDGATGSGAVDVVLALHACDTATDEALARAVRWRAPVVLAAPCCHHDVQRQLDAVKAAGGGPPAPYAALTRHGILQQRFADVLTDAVRANLLRLLGYRVDVVEFVDSRHTPRNALLRARLTGAAPTARRIAEYRDLVAAWQLYPALAGLLTAELAAVLGSAADGSAADGTVADGSAAARTAHPGVLPAPASR